MIEGTADFFVRPEDQGQQKCSPTPACRIFPFFLFLLKWTLKQKHGKRKMNQTEVNAWSLWKSVFHRYCTKQLPASQWGWGLEILSTIFNQTDLHLIGKITRIRFYIYHGEEIRVAICNIFSSVKKTPIVSMSLILVLLSCCFLDFSLRIYLLAFALSALYCLSVSS